MPRYDLAVAGAGLGGLAAAALLARQNRKTVIVEQADLSGGSLVPARKEGFLFSPGPMISFGFERGGALQGLQSVLGISQSGTVLSPCYQVALPDHRISVFQEMGETLEELRREFPGEIDALARLYRDVRKAGVRIVRNRFSAFRACHRRSGAFLNAYRFGRDVRSFFDIQALCFFQRPAHELPFASLVTLLDGAPLHAHGGFYHLTELLLSSLLKNGGEVLYGEPQADVVQRKGRAQGLSLSSGTVLEAAVVLINRTPIPPCTTIFLGVREEVMPLGMAQEVLCLPYHEHPDLLFTLSVNSPEHEHAAPPGMRSITVTFPLLPQGKEPIEKLIPVITGIMPFLDRFLVVTEQHLPKRQAGGGRSPAPVKSSRGARGGSLLIKTSIRNCYEIPDDARAPHRAVIAAQKLAQQLI